MAKLERVINEDLDHLLSRIEQGILDGSISASLEASSDYTVGEARRFYLRSTPGAKRPFWRS